MASFPPGIPEDEQRRRWCERLYGTILANKAYPRGRIGSQEPDPAPDITHNTEGRAKPENS